jgi:hypothetical protein
MGQRNRNSTGKDNLPFYQTNPNLAPDLVLIDTDNITEITYLRELVQKEINPNLIDKAGNSFSAYVVRYNDSTMDTAGNTCGPVGGKGIISSTEEGPPELPPNTVNAIIPELCIGLPLPNRTVQATTQPTISDLCNQNLAAAEKLCNVAPVFEIPNSFSETIRPGNFVQVSLYDKKFPSRGGTVLDVVKNKNGEVIMNPLVSRSARALQVTECSTPSGAGKDATGDNPHPPTDTPLPPGVEAHGDLIIVKKYGLLDKFLERRKRPLPQSIVYHMTGAPANWQGTVRVLNERKVSTHYEIDRKGIVYEYLDPSEFIAYHAGRGNNTLSIGIDMSHNPRVRENSWPEKQIKSAKMLTAYLCKRFSIAPSVAPPRCGPPTTRQGWPSGFSQEGDCEKSKKKVPQLIKEGYTLLRHANCTSRPCPLDFPIHLMVPTAAEVSAVAVADETVPPEDACTAGNQDARKHAAAPRPQGAGGKIL